MSGLTEEFIHRKSSQEITSLLYEAAIHNINEAIAAIQMKDYMEANRNLQKTNDILYRLGAGLNYEAGIISDQLDALYNYLAEQVIEANLKKQIEPLKLALEILTNLAGAWNQGIKAKPDTRFKTIRQKTNIYEQHVMQES